MPKKVISVSIKMIELTFKMSRNSEKFLLEKGYFSNFISGRVVASYTVCIQSSAIFNQHFFEWANPGLFCVY